MSSVTRGVLLGLALAAPLLAAGERAPGAAAFGARQDASAGDYNAQFTFTRIRYGGYGFRGRGGSSWSHDYPQADLNLPTVLAEISRARPTLGTSHVFDLENPAIFRHPIIYVSEPGYWSITQEGALNLRNYLLKGGFVIFDDFEAEQWDNFAEQFRQAMPEYEFIKLDVTHPIFHTFFDLQRLDTPHPLVNVEPIYYGVFEDNDPTKRMIAMVNFNSDLAEYWEWSGRGFFPIDPTNDAYKLGINYIIYGLTH
jgi:uncharacterized protein DUF4159